MAEKFGVKVKKAWNAFRARDETELTYLYPDIGYGSSFNPIHPKTYSSNDRSIATSVYNKIAIDVANFDIFHVRTDTDGKYVETLDDSLNQCLTVEANKDQTGRCLIQDTVISMFDEGVVALVPVDTTISPIISGAYEINSLRVGKITDWYPDHIRVQVYNDQIGQQESITLPKSIVAIVENPFYAIMNQPNGTYKRLLRKLSLLDAVDEQSSSGKLDLIVQLPFVVKGETKTKQAQDRRSEIETQLRSSKYGIAYTGASEHITQLNRPVENNLLAQIKYLTDMFYSQLGCSEDVFNGKADAHTMLNYYNRTVEPVVTTIIEEMRRKFLTKTARKQGQTIMAFRNIFRLTPANELADIVDVFSRNEITAVNEWRQIIGLRPSSDPDADERRNRNMPETDAEFQKRRAKLRDKNLNNDQ